MLQLRTKNKIQSDCGSITAIDLSFFEVAEYKRIQFTTIQKYGKKNKQKTSRFDHPRFQTSLPPYFYAYFFLPLENSCAAE
jgi:hypothetical protein